MSKFSFLLFPLALVFFHCKNDAAAEKQPDVSPMTIDTVTGAPIRSENPWIDRTCELVTDADLKSLFGDKGLETLNRLPLKGESYCLMTWKKADWMERESNNDNKNATYKEPNITLALKIVNFGTKVMAEQQMETLFPKNNPAYDQTVVGLGDAAAWNTNSSILSVRKDHLVLHITLDYADQAIDNLPKAQEVAKVALGKM